MNAGGDRRIPAYADAAGKILLAEKSNADVMRCCRSVAVPIKKHDVTCYGLEACFSIFDYTKEKESKILYELKS